MTQKFVVLFLLFAGTSLGFGQNETYRLPPPFSKRQTCGEAMTRDSIVMMADILNAHNQKRREENAGLGDLAWDDELARRAQGKANTCKMVYEMFTKCHDGDVGQNLYAVASSSFSGADAVQRWYSEKSDYYLADNSCSRTCGHYTQVVWKNTKSVGCAVANCGKKIFGSYAYPDSWMIVCNYFPSGNYHGQKPY